MCVLFYGTQHLTKYIVSDKAIQKTTFHGTDMYNC